MATDQEIAVVGILQLPVGLHSGCKRARSNSGLVQIFRPPVELLEGRGPTVGQFAVEQPSPHEEEQRPHLCGTHQTAGAVAADALTPQYVLAGTEAAKSA